MTVAFCPVYLHCPLAGTINLILDQIRPIELSILLYTNIFIVVISDIGMLIMGLKKTSLWLSWFLTNAVMFLVSLGPSNAKLKI
jgi:hypothetical protein